MESRNFCFPASVIGGFLSVPVSVKSPVVKNSIAPNPAYSLDSKMRPSFEHCTSQPFFLPISVTAVSQMLCLPSTRLTTSCSQPEDFVNTSNDFCGDAKTCLLSARLAPAAAVVRRKSLRFGVIFIAFLLGKPLVGNVFLGML